jgi:hypothetical protein
MTESLGFSCRENLLSQACSCGRGHFGNPEEEDSPLFETAFKQRYWGDVTADAIVCVIVRCRM